MTDLPMTIIELQSQLNALVLRPNEALALDGKIGPKTLAAARKLVQQSRNALPLDHPDEKGNTILSAMQAVLAFRGLYSGKIDGLPGPLTDKAGKLWDGWHWRQYVSEPSSGDARFPAPVRNSVFPRQTAPAMREFYGAPGDNLVHMELPYPMILAWDTDVTIHRFLIHRKLVESAHRALSSILAYYGEDQIKKLRLDRFGGCANVRPMRGGTQPSTHSWGAAIDFDPENNGLRSNKRTALLARPEYDAFWSAWTTEGWLSLGKARDFDWMHVQAAKL